MRKTKRGALRQRVAANLRRARQGRGWSQEELAARAQISQTYTSQIESGQRAVSVDTVEKLSDALGLDPSSLFERP